VSEHRERSLAAEEFLDRLTLTCAEPAFVSFRQDWLRVVPSSREK